MDWVDILRKQQLDFIDRLKQGYLLNCEIKDFNSELTVFSEKAILEKICEFSLRMVIKYRRKDEIPFKTRSQEQIFLNSLKGKIGEEAVKARLNNKISDVDYQIKVNGDGKSDFKLVFNPSIGGIQVKTRNGNFDKVKWPVSKDEIDKNIVIVCMLIQDNIELRDILETRKNNKNFQYNVISAGFLPTSLIKENTSLIKKDGEIELGIDELLYVGGLKAYIDILHEIELIKIVEQFSINPV